MSSREFVHRSPVTRHRSSGAPSGRPSFRCGFDIGFDSSSENVHVIFMSFSSHFQLIFMVCKRTLGLELQWQASET